MSIDSRMLQVMRGIGITTPQQGGISESGLCDPSLRAFDSEMRMMQQLLQPEVSDADDSFDVGSMSMLGGLADERMHSALATISRLFNEQRLERMAPQQSQPRRRAPVSELAKAQVHIQDQAQNDTGRMKADNTVYEVIDGQLSAAFESGKKGSSCIGYDRVGGTSYGTYQIASRTGSMDRFVKYLRTEAPDLARQLENAGPFNTGGKSGKAPRVWKSIVREHGERFQDLQHAFIKKDHYSPARNKILAATGMDIDQAPGIVKQVLWSTSVQHGPTGAARIFNRAIGSAGGAGGVQDFESLVSKVYDTRKSQFNSSSSRVRRSVRSRLAREQDLALSLLRRGVNEVV